MQKQNKQTNKRTKELVRYKVGQKLKALKGKNERKIVKEYKPKKYICAHLYNEP